MPAQFERGLANQNLQFRVYIEVGALRAFLLSAR
jgi:hypothetical protein